MRRSSSQDGEEPGRRVRVVNRQRLVKPRRDHLESLLSTVLAKEGVPDSLRVDVTLVRDRVIRPVNRQYLGRDRPTDVLAFPYIKPSEWKGRHPRLRAHRGATARGEMSRGGMSRGGMARAGTPHGESQRRGVSRGEIPHGGTFLLGDVLVSSDQAALFARSRRADVHRVLAHLALHGLLHLLGYDHRRERDALAMRRLEQRYLRGWTRVASRRAGTGAKRTGAVTKRTGAARKRSAAGTRTGRS